MCRVFQHSPVFRIGGDEFSVILQNDAFRDREKLVQEFRKAMAETNDSAKNPWEQVKVSYGISVYDPEHDGAVIDVVRRADKNMYENKRKRKKED
jgi:diguanylate cyclase (GGDEF)-like protein